MVGRALGPMGFGWLFLGLVLHALTLNVAYGDKCNLPFDLDDQASSASAGGTVKEPVVADISLPDQKLSLAGRLWLQLNGSCPSTADELAALLPGAKLVSIPGSLQVLLYPQHLRAQVGAAAVADVVVENVQLNITSAALPTKINPNSAFTFPGQLLVASIINGTALVSSDMLKNKKVPVPLGLGPSLTANAAGTFSFAATGDLVQLQISKYNLTYRTNYTAGSLSGPVSVWLAGNITAQMTLGCVNGCGLNGKCVRSGSGHVCTCRCGFGGPACSQPQPQDLASCPDLPTFNPAPPAATSAFPLEAEPPPVLGVSGPALAPSMSLPAIGTLTPSLSSLIGSGPASPPGTCSCAQGSGTCPAGWNGPNCDACLNDDVCRTKTSDPDATCNKKMYYTEHTKEKAYVCDISNTILNGLLDPQRGFWVNCSTAEVTNDRNQTGGTCEVGLRLKFDPSHPIICRATACQFRHDSADVHCSNAACECPEAPKGPDGKPQCPDLVQGYIGLVKGQDVDASCTEDGTCTINISNFPIKLTTSCTSGDCVSTTNGVFKQGEVIQHRDYSAVISAIPIIVLLALSILSGFYMMSLSGTWRRDLTPQAKIAEVQRPEHPIECLSWRNLTCTVPASRFAPIVDASQNWGGVQGQADYRRMTSGIELGSLPNSQPFSTGTPTGSDTSHNDKAQGLPYFARQTWKYVCKVPTYTTALFRKPSRICILKDASGEARMGELVGILGPSGCGKTTMLSILAGSVSSLSSTSKIYGEILLDGHQRKSWVSRIVAYVPQFDFLLPTLTVAETLRYSALLRLPKTANHRDVEARVARVLQELGLQHVAGSQVGGSSGIRGISGGERRRVTIGMELVIDPSIVVLDEPTSGLDSYTALNLMVTLKQVAEHGRIVMLSFHQPSPAMFDLLDRAFLMARGHVVFTGRPLEADGYFHAAQLPCPGHTAIAEHMLTCVSDPGLRDRLLQYSLAVRDQGLKDVDTSNGHSVSDVEAGTDRDKAATSNAPIKPQRTPFFRELAVLFWRTLTEIIRNPALLGMHCAMSIAMGLLCGGIFFQLKFDIAGAQGRLGVSFFSLVFMALTSLTTVDLLVNERGLVVKEVLGGYYRPFSYYVSKATLDGLMLRVVPAILYSIPLYPMTGLQSGAPHVALFFTILAVFSATVGAMSMAITVGFGTAGRASLIMNLLLLLGLLFAGFLVNTASISPALAWVHYLSVFFYGFESLTTNEISGTEFRFTAPSGSGGGISLPGTGGIGSGTSLAGVSPSSLSVDIKGDVFLAAIGINVKHLVRNVLILDAYFFLFVTTGVMLLYYTMPRALVIRPLRNLSKAASRKKGSMLRHGDSTASLGEQ
eukprot:jgi/Botrbrau1/20851/Bobra.0156s0075.2